MALRDTLKYALYAIGAGLVAWIGYTVIVERKGRELGQSVSGFISNVGEGIAVAGYGTGYGIQSFMTQTAAGIRSWASLVTDMLNFFKQFASPGAVAYVPPGAPSIHHQSLYKTTYNFRTIQALREGR